MLNKYMQDEIKKAIDNERYELLRQVESWLELPVLLLGFLWLVLLVIELLGELNSALQTVVYFIWIVFIFDFILRLFLAPDRINYLKKNWFTAVSLLIPALRVFRVVRVIRLLSLARTARGIQLLRVLSSLNRGMKSLQKKLEKRSLGYVLILTLLVILVGAAGMHFFEKSVQGSVGFKNYGDSLWWTAMVITTFGSEFWPRSTEGRILGFLLSLYAFTIFGYVTASLASFFIGRDAEDASGEIAGESSIQELRNEIQSLKAEIQIFIEKGNQGNNNSER